MRVNIDIPKKYFDPTTTAKQKRRLMRKHLKHCMRCAKNAKRGY